MEIKFDNLSTNKFFEWLGAKFLEVAMPQIKQSLENTYSDDELLSRKEVSERILKCDPTTADKYFLHKSGFPFVMIGNQRRYPKRAVEKWLSDNTEYN